MSQKFVLIASDKLTASDHQKCYAKCEKTDGDMLKCRSVSDNVPCPNYVHASCVEGLDINIVSFLQNFFCAACCNKFPKIQAEMIRIVKEARQGYEVAANMSTEVSSDVKSLHSFIRELQQKLNLATSQLNAQLMLTDSLERKINNLQDKNKCSFDKAAKIHRSNSTPHAQSSSATVEKEKSQADSFLITTNEAIKAATRACRQSQIKLDKFQEENQSIPTKCQSHATFGKDTLTDNGVWPDYDSQAEKAEELSELSLSLLRSNIAKPQPFTGDVTTWALFLSDFMRTSSRGHYRTFEDMDRLRELIQGEARDMFCTELLDPFAEPLSCLKRLDEFYGVKGNAIRVSLDRIISLQKVDRVNDKVQLKALYIHAKQFAHQCRANNKQCELTSQAVLFIIESKLHQDHCRAWRLWVRENGKQEDVDGIVMFIEERIRELNMLPHRAKFSTNSIAVHFAETTGGPDSSNLSASSTHSITNTSNDDSRSSLKSDRERRRKKREKRLDNIKCFKCKKRHPFWRCPLLIQASDASRLQMVDQLHVCHRCLSSTKHTSAECPNKLMLCRVPDCSSLNSHPLLHGHPPDKIQRFLEIDHEVNAESQCDETSSEGD